MYFRLFREEIITIATITTTTIGSQNASKISQKKLNPIQSRTSIPTIDAVLLIERVLQAKPWRQCRSLAPPRGKKQGKARLRAIIRAGLIEKFPHQTDHIRQAYDLLD